jgi:hypothetical protein
MSKKYTYKATEEIYAKQIRANYARFLETCRASAEVEARLDARTLTADDFESVLPAKAWALAHSWGVLLRKLPGKVLTQPDEHLTKLNAASVLLDVALVTYLDAAEGLVAAIPDARKTSH